MRGIPGCGLGRVASAPVAICGCTSGSSSSVLVQAFACEREGQEEPYAHLLLRACWRRRSPANGYGTRGDIERADKPGSVVGRPFISNVRRRTPQARNPSTRKGDRIVLLFALAPDGVCQAAPLPTRWCALTAPFQLFSQRERMRESSFLRHFPSGRPAQPLAGILPLGARTFLAHERATVWPARICYSSKPDRTCRVHRKQCASRVMRGGRTVARDDVRPGGGFRFQCGSFSHAR